MIMEVFGITLAFIIGAVLVYLYAVLTDPFWKARLMSRIKNKAYIVDVVKTSPSEASGVAVIPIDAKEIKVLGCGYDVVPSMAVRFNGALMLLHDSNNPSPVPIREYDADINHTCFPLFIKVDETIPIKIEKGEIRFGKETNSEPIELNLRVNTKIPIEQIFPDYVFTETPYKGLKEVKELAKEIRYRPNESPKQKSARMDANEIEAEDRARLQHEQLLHALNNYALISLVLIFITMCGVGGVLWSSMGIKSDLSMLQSNFTSVNEGINLLNQTMMNHSITILR